MTWRAAEAAWPGWSRLPAAQRGAVLARAADLIEARVEEIARAGVRPVGNGANRVHPAACGGDRRPAHLVELPRRDPGWKAAPAGVGNTVVLKLAQDARSVARRPARAERAAIEFYTEEITVYHDV
jgi:acyl-CoA reductase-like NAD-dependent aldehyde dehydrogenase